MNYLSELCYLLMSNENGESINEIMIAVELAVTLSLENSSEKSVLAADEISSVRFCAISISIIAGSTNEQMILKKKIDSNPI